MEANAHLMRRMEESFLEFFKTTFGSIHFRAYIVRYII